MRRNPSCRVFSPPLLFQLINLHQFIHLLFRNLLSFWHSVHHSAINVESLNENGFMNKAVSWNEFAEITENFNAHTTHASGEQSLDCITHSGCSARIVFSHKVRSIPSATQQWYFPGKLFRQESKSFPFLPHLRTMNTCMMRAMPVANIYFPACKSCTNGKPMEKI